MKQTIKKDEINLKHKFGMLDFFFYKKSKPKQKFVSGAKIRGKEFRFQIIAYMKFELRFCRQTNYNSLAEEENLNEQFIQDYPMPDPLWIKL